MNLAPEYVLARRVLLDAFDALGSQRDAVVLVGAQAIYLQVGDGDLARRLAGSWRTGDDGMRDAGCLGH